MSILLRKVSHVLGWLVVFGMLFLLVSLASYHLDDPAGNFYVSHAPAKIHNYGGTAGAILADWTLQTLGCAVALLIGILVLSAWWLFLGRMGAALTVCWRGVCCLIVGSAYAYLTFPQDPIWGKVTVAGGVGGQWLAGSLMVYLGRPGTYAVLSLMVVGVLFMGLDSPRLAALWHRITRFGRRGMPQEKQVQDAPTEEMAAHEPEGRVLRPRRMRVIPTSSDTVTASDVPPLALPTAAIPAVAPVDVTRAAMLLAETVCPVAPVDVTRVAMLLAETVRPVAPADTGPLAPPDLQPHVMVTPRPVPAVAPTPVVQESPTTPPAQQPSRLLGPSGSAPRTSGRRRTLAIPQIPVQAAPPAEAPAPSVPPALQPAIALPPRSVARPPSESPVVLPPAATAPPPLLRPRPSLVAMTLPSLELLDRPEAPQRTQSAAELEAQARFLAQKLREFGVEGEVVQVLPGPVITTYEFAPAAGVKVSKILNLQDDLALVMEAVSVRVVAPIPGKAAVGIEIPHAQRETVCLRDLLESDVCQATTSILSVALGKDTLGHPVLTNLELIPHLLIAGATGSGKSVGLNSLICSLLFRATPADVKLIMIDPKRLEFSVYDGIPHLLVPVVTEPKQAAMVLRRVVAEMGRRYQILAAQGVRNIAQYNQRVAETAQHSAGSSPQPHMEKLPYLVVIIDELSDLMMVSARDVEDSLMRLAQMARAAGIHLIVATQRPSVDVLTGVIKANFPARLSFQVASKVDSRTILDTNGAETLLGSGDMLFLAPGTSKPQRLHGAYVSEAEMRRLVAAWRMLQPPDYDATFLATAEERASIVEEEYDDKYYEAVALVTKTGQASISMLQRRLRVGYNRAARMIEMMEKDALVGPADGMKPRVVFLRDTSDASA